MAKELWIPDESKRATDLAAALIERDYNDLMFYDRPILFTGLNVDGVRVLGSSVEEDRATESYLQALISDETFAEFVARLISYPEALRRAHSLYLLHWTGGGNPTGWLITFDDIPADYRPSEKALCPEDVELIPSDA